MDGGTGGSWSRRRRRLKRVLSGSNSANFILYNDVNDKQAEKERERKREGSQGRRGWQGAIFTHICGTQAAKEEEGEEKEK